MFSEPQIFLSLGFLAKRFLTFSPSPLRVRNAEEWQKSWPEFVKRKCFMFKLTPRHVYETLTRIAFKTLKSIVVCAHREFHMIRRKYNKERRAESLVYLLWFSLRHNTTFDCFSFARTVVHPARSIPKIARAKSAVYVIGRPAVTTPS